MMFGPGANRQPEQGKQTRRSVRLGSENRIDGRCKGIAKEIKHNPTVWKSYMRGRDYIYHRDEHRLPHPHRTSPGHLRTSQHDQDITFKTICIRLL